MASSVNLNIFLGDDKDLSITVKDDNDNIVDLTSYNSVYWFVKKYGLSATPILTKTAEVGSGITVTDAANGLLNISINSADTQSLNPGEYYHELRYKDSNSDLATIMTGYINFYASEET